MMMRGWPGNHYYSWHAPCKQGRIKGNIFARFVDSSIGGHETLNTRFLLVSFAVGALQFSVTATGFSRICVSSPNICDSV